MYKINETPPKSQTVKIGVYGTLKEGYGNWNWALKNKSTRLPDQLINNLQMVHLGGFPGVIPGDKAVVMEVYEISLNTLREIDYLEGIPHLYRRYYDEETGIYFYMYNGTIRENHQKIEVWL